MFACLPTWARRPAIRDTSEARPFSANSVSPETASGGNEIVFQTIVFSKKKKNGFAHIVDSAL